MYILAIQLECKKWYFIGGTLEKWYLSNDKNDYHEFTYTDAIIFIGLNADFFANPPNEDMKVRRFQLVKIDEIIDPDKPSCSNCYVGNCNQREDGICCQEWTPEK